MLPAELHHQAYSVVEKGRGLQESGDLILPEHLFNAQIIFESVIVTLLSMVGNDIGAGWYEL